jgi:hypothetical protein
MVYRGAHTFWANQTRSETTDRKKAARDERLKRGWETRRHRKADKAALFEVKSGCDLFVSVHVSISQYIP